MLTKLLPVETLTEAVFAYCELSTVLKNDFSNINSLIKKWTRRKVKKEVGV